MEGWTFTGKVHRITRLNNSVNGNPRRAVSFESDPTRFYITQSDAGFVYGIENPNMRGEVRVWLTRAERISHMEPHKD